MGVVMQSKQRAEKHLPLEERPKYERVATELPGKLSVRAKGDMIECLVSDLCSSGAGVICKKAPLLHTYVVLHINGFGSFECVTSRYTRGTLDLRFVGKEERRRYVLADIKNFVAEGQRLRQRQNMPLTSELRFTRPNGEQFRCGVVNAFGRRLLLRTDIQPAIGEVIHMAQTYGRVVRHYREGIAIQLLRTGSDTQVPREKV